MTSSDAPAGPCPVTRLQLQVWKGTVYLTPLLGAFLADAYLGRFWVILIFSIIYFIVSTGAPGPPCFPGVKFFGPGAFCAAPGPPCAMV